MIGGPRAREAPRPEAPKRALSRRSLLRVGGGLAALPPLALAADFGAAAWVHGPEYVRRLLLWPRSRSGETALFPARPIAPAEVPFRFAEPAADAPALVRAAFARVSARHGLAGVDLDRALARSATTGFAVVQDDRLLHEAYFGGGARGSEQPSFSVAKSVVSLLVGAAIADGLVPSADTEAEALLPDVRGLRGSGVRVRHLLRMSAGFRYRGGGPRREFLLGPWSHTRLLVYGPDLRRVAAGVEPAHAPGARFTYDGRCTQLLGMILERAAGEPVAGYLGRRLWRPMGAEFPASWSLDSEASGLERLESGLNASTLDFAKLGRLVLRRGDWDGARLLPAEWIDAATSPPEERGPLGHDGDGAGHPAGVPGGYYGFHWWGLERPDGRRVPFAAGLFGQCVLVDPAKRAVLVRNGDNHGGVEDWPALLADLADALP